MKITFDIKFLAIAIVSGIFAYMTATESIDKYINFAGELNAMAFFLVASMMSAFSLVASISKAK
tara:strand:- start:182 stop:373 length:192 start_codon:yes stop_codon:yes gene_type:complete